MVEAMVVVNHPDRNFSKVTISDHGPPERSPGMMFNEILLVAAFNHETGSMSCSVSEVSLERKCNN